ncbi:MAG: hypothetical protein ACETWR_15445 [Anaerolineae bacterium]
MRDAQHPSPEEMTAHLARAVYEPTYQDPARELEVCLNFYRALLDELREYDDMEVAAHLCYRDGIATHIARAASQEDHEGHDFGIEALSQEHLAWPGHRPSLFASPVV